MHNPAKYRKVRQQESNFLMTDKHKKRLLHTTSVNT